MKLYGPYYRAEKKEIIKLQIESNELWGNPPRNTYHSDIPKIQALSQWIWGEGIIGVKFYTTIPPDKGSVPGQPNWSGGQPGVRIEDGVAKMKVTKIEIYPYCLDD